MDLWRLEGGLKGGDIWSLRFLNGLLFFVDGHWRLGQDGGCFKMSEGLSK